MQHQFLGVIQQNPARAVHNTLGLACGTGRKQNISGVVERHGGITGRLPLPGLQGCLPRHHAGAFGQRLLGQLFNHHDPLYRWQPLAYRLQILGAAEHLATVAISIDHHQQGRLNLREPIQNGAHPEIGRGRAESRPHAGCGQHRNQRLIAIGHNGGHTIAPGNPLFSEIGLKRTGVGL